jgi:hypothetical protein
MRTIDLILNEICSKGYKVDTIIQHSYNPDAKTNFYVYSEDNISHIVSTYPDKSSSGKKFKKEKLIMEEIINKVCNKPLNKNILYSNWIIDLPVGSFHIQEYKKRSWVFRPNCSKKDDLEKYLEISNDWIIKFQSATKIDFGNISPNEIKEKIESQINKWINLYLSKAEFVQCLVKIKDNLRFIHTPMIQCMQHGDYCYYNTFLDENKMFRIIDWEFSKKSGWVTFDYLTNFWVTWMGLKTNRLVRDALDVFFNPINEFENLLSKGVLKLNTLYGFDNSEIKLYLAFECFRLFLREERPASARHLYRYVPYLMKILDSLK